MERPISIAIETSSRAGGVALGRGGELLQALRFDASSRHATQLVVRLDELLRGAGLPPRTGAGLRLRDVAELYVSCGPGSFTGLRVGITVARTLAQMSPSLRVVAVPTIQAVAENARDLPWRRLGVVMDYKDGEVYAMTVGRATALHAEPGGCAITRATSPTGRQAGCTPYENFGPALIRPEDFLARAPRPLLLIGEALEFVRMEAEGVTLCPPELNLPTPEGVWRVGRRLAEAGQFIDYRKLLPLYTRKPEAVRLWEKLGRA